MGSGNRAGFPGSLFPFRSISARPFAVREARSRRCRTERFGRILPSNRAIVRSKRWTRNLPTRCPRTSRLRIPDDNRTRSSRAVRAASAAPSPKRWRREGYAITVTGLEDEEVETFRESSSSREVTAERLDVRSVRHIRALVARLERLDVLVQCAGTLLRDDAEYDPETFAQVVDVNLCGAMRVATAFRPRLAESRGCVVHIASMLSFFGSPHVPGYSSSKGGLVQLTKSLAIAWAREGIRVNAVAPGWIETEMTRPLVDDPDRRDAITDRTPLGRWGQPEDVAGRGLLPLLSRRCVHHRSRPTGRRRVFGRVASSGNTDEKPPVRDGSTPLSWFESTGPGRSVDRNDSSRGCQSQRRRVSWRNCRWRPTNPLRVPFPTW